MPMQMRLALAEGRFPPGLSLCSSRAWLRSGVVSKGVWGLAGGRGRVIIPHRVSSGCGGAVSRWVAALSSFASILNFIFCFPIFAA